MKNFIKLLALIYFSFFNTAAGNTEDNKKIEINVKYPFFISKTATVEVKNNESYPLSVKIKIFNDILDSDVIGEKIFSIKPSSKIKFELDPLPGKKFSGVPFCRHQYALGPIASSEKENRFQIPFEEGMTVKICQSFDGPLTTHTEKTYAIDFCATEKTPILSAMDGIILEVVDNFTEGGKKPELLDKANYVRILHPDGTQTSYVHIFPRSATVSIGDKVKAGQMIALVGAVGYTNGPHLHFEYFYNDPNLNRTVANPNFFSNSGEKIKISYGSMISRNGVFTETKISQAKSENNNNNNSNQNQEQSNYNISDSSLSQTAKECHLFKGDEISKANECIINGNYEKGIEILTALTEKNKSNGRAFALLGISYSKLGRHEEAIKQFKKSMALGRASYQLYAFYAISSAAIGQLDDAIKYNREALKIVPDLLDVRKRLSEQLLTKGMKKEALELLENYDNEQRRLGKEEFFKENIKLIKENSK